RMAPCCGGRGPLTRMVTGVFGVRPASPPAGRSHHHLALCLLTGGESAGSGTTGYMDHGNAEQGTNTVFLADDNLIVREGVRALIERHGDLQVVGVAADYDGVVNGATAASPQVLV